MRILNRADEAIYKDIFFILLNFKVFYDIILLILYCIW